MYWPDTKTVTVEHSVYFPSSNISNEMPLEELDRDIPDALKPCQKVIADNSGGVSTLVQDNQDKTLQPEVGDINNKPDL